MNRTLYLVFAFVACSYVTCQSCSGSEGFITEQPTPETNDELFFINLTAVANGTSISGVTINLLNEERLNVTVDLPLLDNTGIWPTWGVGDNGNIGYETGVACLGNPTNTNQNMSITLYFNPPVTTVAMKTNYDPSYPNYAWGPPRFTVIENGSPVVCYNIAALAPISTPGDGKNQFAWRGVTNDTGISALSLDGAQIAAWDIVIIRKSPTVSPVTNPIPVASPNKNNTPGKSSNSATLVLSISTLIAFFL